MFGILATQLNPEHNAFEIYVAGCNRHCPHCQNPEAQEFGIGKKFPIWLRENAYKFRTGLFRNVWILGGDLVDHAEADIDEFIYGLKKVMKDDVDLWLWTGHEFDEPIVDRIKRHFDWVKTGEYREKLPVKPIYYYNNEGINMPLILASENQCLHAIKPMEHTECQIFPIPSLEKNLSPESPDSRQYSSNGLNSYSQNAVLV